MKPVSYTATPEQFTIAAIMHPALLASPSSSQTTLRIPTKCMHFADTLLLINYRAVYPFPTAVDAQATYPEPDPQDRNRILVDPPSILLAEEWDMIASNPCQRKCFDKKIISRNSLNRQDSAKILQCGTPMIPLKRAPKPPTGFKIPWCQETKGSQPLANLKWPN